ncbi:hypothetical protein [Marvinbryantia formatexigens]|nr:hypothetical protein [Marvinbryantia formatexigens]UWO24428.1 hypothetical protein NQ534_18735 [Marvinbryantia formatexigens DSM 14469]SDF07218.1 hypothetical protein SAMN05660368_00014 [Marvinbryantia formatexigens]
MRRAHSGAVGGHSAADRRQNERYGKIWRRRPATERKDMAPQTGGGKRYGVLEGVLAEKNPAEKPGFSGSVKEPGSKD